MGDTRVSVQVAGQPVNLRGIEDEAYIKSVAAYVDEKVEAMQKTYPALSTSNCVVLSAINIADELFKLRQQYAEMDRRIDELRKLTSAQNGAARRNLKEPQKLPFEQPAEAFERSTNM